MGQEIGKLPETDVMVRCEGIAWTDAIQRQIRAGGHDFARSSDAALLRTASKWVTEQPSWVTRDLQVSVYGESSWTFFSGRPENQVAFYADTIRVDEPAWTRVGWKLKLYNYVKLGLNYLAKGAVAIAPAAYTTAGPVGGALAIGAGTAAYLISERMGKK